MDPTSALPQDMVSWGGRSLTALTPHHAGQVLDCRGVLRYHSGVEKHSLRHGTARSDWERGIHGPVKRQGLRSSRALRHAGIAESLRGAENGTWNCGLDLARARVRGVGREREGSGWSLGDCP